MNFIRRIISRESEFNFLDNFELLDLVKELDSKKSPNEILSSLEKIHKLIKEFVGMDSLSKKLSIDGSETHSKEIYMTLNTSHGYLRFEKMHFLENKTTLLHTHPEFIIDEIISGSFQESLYVKNNKSEYQLVNAETKIKGDILRICDYSGHPHKIKAIGGDCITACLYLGHDYVRLINEQNYH